MPADPPHPIYALAQGCLAHGKVLLGRTIPRRQLERACGYAGAGLDPIHGERPLAFGDDSASDPMQLYFLATDRRMLGCYHGEPFQIPHVDLVQVHYRPGILLPELELFHPGGRQRLAFPTFVEGIARFCQTLAAQHPAHRTPAPEPLVDPSAGDPAGARRALAELGEDPRASLVARVVAAMVERGQVAPEAGADLVARVMLHHRSATCGPGMKEGCWVSALSARDLSCAVAWVLGPATSHEVHGDVHQLVYSAPSSDARARAAVSTAVGLAALAIVGVGWVSTAGPILKRVRLTVRDSPSSSSFTLEGTTGGAPAPLTRTGPALQSALLGALPGIEARLLLARALHGWTHSPDQLGAIPPEELLASVASLLGSAAP